MENSLFSVTDTKFIFVLCMYLFSELIKKTSLSVLKKQISHDPNYIIHTNTYNWSMFVWLCIFRGTIFSSCRSRCRSNHEDEVSNSGKYFSDSDQNDDDTDFCCAGYLICSKYNQSTVACKGQEDAISHISSDYGPDDIHDLAYYNHNVTMDSVVW